MSAQDEFAAWFDQVLKATDDRAEALRAAHEMLRTSGLLSKVTLHKYMCAKGCQIATVFRASGLLLCAVRDYKLSPGLNVRETAPRARETKTLDGQRHWPGHVYDVEQLHRFRAGGQRAAMRLTCRHCRTVLFTDDVLAVVEGVEPGRPGKPTRLT